MAKKQNEEKTLAQTGNHNTGLEAIPDFLKGQEIVGVDELKNLIRPQRIKIVQKSADKELLDNWGVGDVLIVPSLLPLINMPRDTKGNPVDVDCEPVPFTPILFFREFLALNDIATRGTLPMIRERTFDPKSSIAQKAMNPQLRTVVENGVKIRYVDALCFLIVLRVETPLGNEPVVLTFQSGSYSLGQHLCSLIKMRKSSLYNCVFEMRPKQITSAQGFDYFGMAVDNPTNVKPWVTKEENAEYAAMHKELAEALNSARLVIEHEDRPSGDIDPASTKATDKF